MITVFFLCLQSLSDFFAISRNGFRLRSFVVLYPFVGKLRLTLYFIYRNGKLCRLTRKLRILVLFRKSYLYRYLVSGFLSDKLVFKSRNKASGSQLQILLFRCTAVKLFAVNGAAVVDIYGISFFGRFLYCHKVFRQSLLNGRVHLILCNIAGRCNGNGYRFEVGKCNLSHFGELRLFRNLHVFQLLNLGTVFRQSGRAGHIGFGNLGLRCLVFLVFLHRFLFGTFLFRAFLLSARRCKHAHSKNQRYGKNFLFSHNTPYFIFEKGERKTLYFPLLSSG